MFIIKDLRKIPEILTDKNDEKKELKLARRYLFNLKYRGPELKGSIDILTKNCNNENINNVNYLSLYNDGLNTLNVKFNLFHREFQFLKNLHFVLLIQVKIS